MRKIWQPLATAIVLLAMAAPAAAQEKTDPDEITIGVARLTLSMAYASVRVNGEEWEQSFFENDGLLMILEGMDRSVEYVFHLVPMEEEYRFVDVKVIPKDWKLKRIDRQTRQWQLNRKITFRKWKPGEQEEWERKQVEADEVEEQLDEKPVEKPVEKPDEKPVEKPVETPKDSP